MKKLTCILAVMLMLCLCTVAYAADPVTLDITALDYQTGKAILALLYDLCRQSRKTVIVVTHNGALAPTADILIRMKNGKIESFAENPHPVPVQELEW